MIPVIKKMEVYPVAGLDSMELNLSGAHAPYFTRNVVILTDSNGVEGVGEVPGGEKITKALGLQEPDRYIRIEDVATPKEIEKAQHARLKEGKHIIPVPTMELKPHFRGYLIDPIKTMWRRRTLKKQDQDTLGQIGSEGFERSVVRPAFSYYGRLTFDDDVIIKLIRNGLKKVAGVDETSIISFKKSDKGQNGLVVDMAVVIEHGYPVKPLMQQVQKSVRNEIEYITGMSIERMSIKVKNIIETKRKIVKV